MLQPTFNLGAIYIDYQFSGIGDGDHEVSACDYRVDDYLTVHSGDFSGTIITSVN